MLAKFYAITDTKGVFIGSDLPDQYSNSNLHKLKGQVQKQRPMQHKELTKEMIGI